MSELLVFTVIFLMKGLFLDLSLRRGSCCRSCKNNFTPPVVSKKRTSNTFVKCCDCLLKNYRTPSNTAT
ncbi:hypothetical protein DYU21_10500 [Salmonella enterica]|nr:hypothetical protein [Salmonella enterica]